MMKQNPLNKLSNLSQRVVVALVAIPLVILAIQYNVWTYWLLFLAITVLTQREFYMLLKLDENMPLAFWGTFCGVVLNTLVFFVERGRLTFQWYYLMVPLFAITFFIKLFRKKDTRPFANLGYTFLGIIYVAVPFALLHEIIISEYYYRPNLVIGLLVLIWANDTGAYFAGTYFGRKKLFERISPKKTWEGFFGGMIITVLVAWAWSRLYTDLNLTNWLIIGAIISITGTLGDLVESLFKRSISIKDSGSSIPGHGGFLDRFDGLLLSMPFIVSYIKLIS